MRATGFAVNRLTISHNSSGQPQNDSVAFGLRCIIAIAVNRKRAGRERRVESAWPCQGDSGKSSGESSGQPHKDSVASGLGGIVPIAVNRKRTAFRRTCMLIPPPTSSSLPPPPLGFRFVAFGLGGIVAIAVNRKEAHRVENPS